MKRVGSKGKDTPDGDAFTEVSTSAACISVSQSTSLVVMLLLA